MDTSVKYSFSGDGKMNKRQTNKKLLCAILEAVLVIVAVIVFIACTAVAVSEFKNMGSEFSELRKEIEELKHSMTIHSDKTDESKTEVYTEIRSSLPKLLDELKDLKTSIKKNSVSQAQLSHTEDTGPGFKELKDEIIKLTDDVAAFQAQLLEEFIALSSNITDDINESIDQTKNTRRNQLKDFMNDKIHKNQQFTKLTSRINERFSKMQAIITQTKIEVQKTSKARGDQQEAAKLAVLDAVNRMSSYVIEDLQNKMDEVKDELKDMIGGKCLAGGGNVEGSSQIPPLSRS